MSSFISLLKRSLVGILLFAGGFGLAITTPVFGIQQGGIENLEGARTCGESPTSEPPYSESCPDYSELTIGGGHDTEDGGMSIFGDGDFRIYSIDENSGANASLIFGQLGGSSLKVTGTGPDGQSAEGGLGYWMENPHWMENPQCKSDPTDPACNPELGFKYLYYGLYTPENAYIGDKVVADTFTLPSNSDVMRFYAGAGGMEVTGSGGMIFKDWRSADENVPELHIWPNQAVYIHGDLKVGGKIYECVDCDAQMLYFAAYPDLISLDETSILKWNFKDAAKVEIVSDDAAAMCQTNGAAAGECAGMQPTHDTVFTAKVTDNKGNVKEYTTNLKLLTADIEVEQIDATSSNLVKITWSSENTNEGWTELWVGSYKITKSECSQAGRANGSCTYDVMLNPPNASQTDETIVFAVDVAGADSQGDTHTYRDQDQYFYQGIDTPDDDRGDEEEVDCSQYNGSGSCTSKCYAKSCDPGAPACRVQGSTCLPQPGYADTECNVKVCESLNSPI